MKASPMKNQFIGSPPYREINGGEPMPPFLSRIPKARQKDTAKQWRTLRTNTNTPCRLPLAASAIHSQRLFDERILFMTTTHLELKLGGIRASADLQLTPADILAIQTDSGTAERYAAATATAAMAEVNRSNPKWPMTYKQKFAVEAAAATMACIHAM